MVIHFCPGKLGVKPDALTRQWDVYCKGGNSDFASINPSNMKPIFTENQLIASLRATYLATLIIHNAIVMDMEKLHVDICSTLPNDPISSPHLPTPDTPDWTIDEFGLLHHHDRIFVLDSRTSASKSSSTIMTTSYPDTSDKTKPLNSFDASMSGLIFGPWSNTSAVHALLANAPKHHVTNPMVS